MDRRRKAVESMLQPVYTMNGLEVQDETKANGNVHTQVFRDVLTSFLEKFVAFTS